MNGAIGRLQRGEYLDLTVEQLFKDYGGKVSFEQCIELCEEMKRQEVWLCKEYQVTIDKTPRHAFRNQVVWHLSIKRRDKEPIHDWRDLQEIKNQLCGPEIEAMEIYPAESRKVDSANQYHLWALMLRKHAPRREKNWFPVGWTVRFVQDDPFVNGKQRPVKTGEATNPIEQDGPC